MVLGLGWWCLGTRPALLPCGGPLDPVLVWRSKAIPFAFVFVFLEGDILLAVGIPQAVFSVMVVLAEM